jgi:uncharacterized protein
MQFMVLGYDGTDPDAPGRRTQARPAHLAKMDELRDRGRLSYAGALLDDGGQMIGSLVIVDVESRADVDTWLADEPYVKGDVWRDITVTRFRGVPPSTP